VNKSCPCPLSKIREIPHYIIQNRLNLEYISLILPGSLKKEDYQDIKERLESFLPVHSCPFRICPPCGGFKIRDVTVERFLQVMEIAELLRPNCRISFGYEKWKYGTG